MASPPATADVEALRAEGNALFKAKDFDGALARYTAALEASDDDDNDSSSATTGARAQEQRVLLFSNRAACHLQLAHLTEAAEDASRALDLDPGNEKARYRRAQALTGLGRHAEAFADLRRLVQLSPGNKAAAQLAHRVQELLQRDARGIHKALDAIRAVDVDATSGGSSGEDGGGGDKALEALKYLEAQCVQDLGAFPQELADKGGVAVLWDVVGRLLGRWDKLQQQQSPPQSTEGMGTMLTHVVGLLGVVASATSALAGLVNAGGAEKFVGLVGLLHAQVEAEYQDKATTSTTTPVLPVPGLKHLIKLTAFIFKHLMLMTDDDAAIRRALNGLLDGLRSSRVELQLSGLDGLLHFISTPTSAPKGPAGTSKSQEDDRVKQRKLRFATLAQELGLFSLLHATAAGALRVSPRTTTHEVLLSRLPLVFTQCLAQFEANEAVLKKLVRDHCVAPMLVVAPTDPRLVDRASAACLLLSALFLSNGKLALWAVQQTANDGTAFLARLHDCLAASRTSSEPRERTRRLQEIWVDCVASICGVEGGTDCVPSTLRGEIHKMLQASLDDEDLVLRASALSIQIKLAVVEKALEVETPEGQFLIEQVFEVLEEAHAFEAAAGERQTMMYWSGASPKERGIEALSYVITQTSVKEAFVQHPKAIESVFAVDFAEPPTWPSPRASIGGSGDHRHVPHVGYRANVYYGIGYILHHTLTSEGNLKKKQMEGMEMTPEQYEELQKALRQKSVLEDGDAPDKVQRRVEGLVRTTAVLTTLVKLLKFATTRSSNVVEMATLSALHAAEVASVRGRLVQCGVFQALIPLALHASATAGELKDPKKKRPAATPGATKISNAAGQAMAKILISTNPNLVPSSSLLSSIKPLLELCKGDTQLLQFEALMALTNIASVSEETKNRIVGEPQGLSTLQYLQFSEHELVRRAATEAICNLLPNDQVIEKIFLNEEKMRLWLAFASVEEEAEDFETARAAAGALAMVSQVPAVSWLMMQQGALGAFTRVLEVSTHEETVHRALFALENMMLTLAESQDADKAESKKENLATLQEHRAMLISKVKEIASGRQGSFAPPTQEAAQSCLGALVKCAAAK